MTGHVNPEVGDGWATVLDALGHRAAADPDGLAYAFIDDRGGAGQRLTYAELASRARIVATAIRRVADPGDRAVLLFPPGLDFVAAFFGCLTSGAIAVPAYPPRPKRPAGAAASILADSAPRAVLTTAEIAPMVGSLARGTPTIVIPDIEDRDAGPSRPERIDPSSVAMLQYTSGSTTDPRGVMITHANLVHNQRLLLAALGPLPGPAVSWLPLYHDMGLIGHVLYPLWCGVPSYLMSPLDFLQRPASWLETITRVGAAIATAPNFAYDLCLRRVGAEQHTGLDLSRWSLALNGAEPVSAETAGRFAETFAACGFDRRSVLPCYGLAEATLFVTGGPRGEGAQTLPVDPGELERNRIAPLPADDPDARTLVACGCTWLDQQVAIVDPDTRAPCPSDTIGEIWISGPSVAAGYWNRPGETTRTFGARLCGDDGRTFLRTGDLGFLRDGRLYVTGRLSDLIIVMGRNHYPQDIERTSGACHPLLKPGRGAAFTARIDGQERLIVAHEVIAPCLSANDARDILERMRQSVAERHDLGLHDAVLLVPGGLPLTTSGKIRRSACRAGYLAGTLARVREDGP